MGIVFGLVSLLLMSIGLFVLNHEVEPERVQFAQDGVILHYNSPAAIQTSFGTTVGFQSTDGSINVVTADNKGVSQPETVHKFETPNDHASPAIIRMPEGKHAGQFFLATSRHSSDLYIYRSTQQKPSGFIFSCRIKGRYTYPRFVVVGGKTLLFVRTEFEEPSKLTEHRGALGVIDVTKDDCSIPKVLVFPEFREFIYAVTPVADEDAVYMAWTIYDGHKLTYTRSYTGKYDPITNEMTATPMAVPKILDEAMVWSVASRNDTVAVSHFSGISKYMSGHVKSGLYRPDEGTSSSPTYMTSGIGPFYPFAKVLHPLRREYLEPETTEEATLLKRRSYGLGWPWLKSCTTKGRSSSPQYVGDSTSYVFIETDEEYRSRGPFKTRLVLCKTRSWLEIAMSD